MSGHPHAKLAQEYWKEAETNAEAWKSWEYQFLDSKTWIQCTFEPLFMRNLRYRRIPRMININGHEVPEPLRVKPNFGDLYYFPELSMPSDACENCDWEDDETDNERLIAGICHSTQEAAIAHAKALLSFTQKGGEP
jgi:hypothetical protein